jgi:Ran GTPase-activating protein (RanGAP) involved in mRNA processing and transport
MPTTLYEIERNTNANILSLVAMGITDKDMIVLAQYLKEHPEIDTIDLHGNRLGDIGVITLSIIHSIKRLDVSDNKISDIGAKILAEKSKLSSLNINSNLIGTQGAIALLCNETIKYLDMRLNDIDDKKSNGFTDALKGNASLREIKLQGNRFKHKRTIELIDEINHVTKRNSYSTRFHIEHSQRQKEHAYSNFFTRNSLNGTSRHHDKSKPPKPMISCNLY